MNAERLIVLALAVLLVLGVVYFLFSMAGGRA